MYGENAAIPLLLIYALFNWQYTLSAIVISIFFLIVPICRIFKKAGHAWWKALIPFYNIYIFTLIIGVPWWYMLLLLIPFVNIIVCVYFAHQLSKRFGFGILFTVGLLALPFTWIFLSILGYTDLKYTAKTEIK